MGKLLHKVDIRWSGDFAYAIGLIATDGWLNKDGRHIGFISKDRELVEKFKGALGVKNTITLHARGGEIDKKYFGIHVGDKTFYKFLNSIGITPAKSKTIQKVDIPNDYFVDFLRGVFDGDGSFYTL